MLTKPCLGQPNMLLALEGRLSSVYLVAASHMYQIKAARTLESAFLVSKTSTEYAFIRTRIPISICM